MLLKDSRNSTNAGEASGGTGASGLGPRASGDEPRLETSGDGRRPPAARGPRPEAYWLVAAVIGVLAIITVASTHRTFSQTVDEPIHVAAGFERLTTDRYSIDLEHPPLARMIFATPAWLGGVRVDATADRVSQGNEIIEANGIAKARAGNLLFFALAMASVAIWARRLFGNVTGLLAVALFAALPPILAHAGLATTDMSVTAMTVTSLLALDLWLDRASWPRSILLGVAIALGMLSKFSFLAFFPVGAAVVILARRDARPNIRPLGALASLIVAAIVVWAGYGFSFGNLIELRLTTMPTYSDEHVAAKYAQTRGYEWVRPDLVRRYYLDSKRSANHVDFVDWAKAAGYPSPLAGRSGRDTMAGVALREPRFSERALEPLRRVWHWIARHVPLPAPMYIAGAKLVKVHSELGHPAFLFGKRSERGWWYYFPVLLFFKTPLPFLILAVVGIVSTVRKHVAIVPVALLAVTLTSSINIGVRHVLPLYPFLAICAAHAVVGTWRGWRRVATGILLLWHFGTTVIAYPDYLAWFNEVAGPHPEQIALDSNLDWGQDLHRLEDFVREKKIDRIHIAYFGSADLRKTPLPAHHLPEGQCATGWVAISEHLLQFDGYKWLKSMKPEGRAGKSIRVYFVDNCP